MKLYTKLICIAVFLAGISCVTSSCKKDNGSPSPDEVVIAKDVQVINNQVWNDNLVAVDTSDYTIRFSKNISTSQSFKAGDYIVSSSGEGLLRKITNVSTLNDETVLQTESATLEDVIEQGDIDLDQPLTVSQVRNIDYYYSGVRLVNEGSKGADATQFKWDMADVVLYDYDGNNSTANDQIKISGNFECTYRITGKIKISWTLKLKEVKFGFKSSENLNLNLNSGVKYNFERKYTLASVNFTPITVFVGPVPVVFVPNLKIILGIDGSADGSLSSGITQNLSFDAGIKYIKGDGWSPYSDFDKSFTPQPLVLKANASAGASLKPELSIKVYGVAGPFANLKFYSRLEANYLSEAFHWKLYGGVMMGVGAKVEILGKSLKSFSKDDLFKYELMLTQSTTPVTLPSISTGAITTFTTSSATGGGNVTSDGGATVTGRGVCWSTLQNPTAADSKTSDGTGTGAFTSNLTGLNANTTYYVRAYAVNNAGTSYGNQVSFKTEPAGLAPVANFITEETTITAGMPIEFADKSTNTPTGWSWNFGDGGTSLLKNPSHIYSTPGTYTVTLTVTNSFGSDSETKPNYITVNQAGIKPVADFTAASTTIAAGGTVTFTDQSTNTPTGWSWNFGDGGTSTLQNPSHVYNTAGSYTVSLMATNSFGSTTAVKNDYITVNQAGSAPVADFSGIPTTITAGGSVAFSDLSTNTPTGWSWDFGDGGTSSSQNPTHVYTTPGSYTVTLIATNNFGSATAVKNDYITVNPGGNETGTFTDPRDGNTYNTVKIGNQTWMSENVKYLPSVAESGTASETVSYYYVYNYNGTNTADAKATANYQTYGVLYNWTAALSACPTGWHLPTDAEFTELENFLAANGYNYDGTTGGSGEKIAKAMSATSYWWATSITGSVGNTDYPDFRNKSGFTALPGGWLAWNYTFGSFGAQGTYAFFYSASMASETNAYSRAISNGSTSITKNSGLKSCGSSVRCLKD